MSAGLTLLVLGPLEIRSGGAPVSLPAKTQALLVYLAMTGRRARREALADMFWGDTGEDGARANLRLALTKLRQALPGVVDTDAESVALLHSAPLQVDALQLLRTVDTLLQQPAAALEAAVAVYRGPFLQDFGLRDCAGFEDWVAAERQRIDRRAVVLLRELAQGARRTGKTGNEIRYLGQWARIEPWNEEAQLPLIRLLAQTGSTAAALDSFEACRQALAEELAARPSVALALLAEQVRRGEVTAPASLPFAAAAAQPLAPAVTTPAGAAVEPAAPLYGREQDLNLVRERIARGDRLVTLLGPAGIGKSRLARALAQSLAPDYPDGQVNCSFDFLDSGIGEEASQDHFAATIGSALGLDLDLTAQPLNMLKAHLATRRIILGLDGFEACIKATPAVVEVLQAAPQCLLLVTSRMRLAVSHGWTHELKGLGADAGEGRGPAVDLLVDCAHRAGVTLDNQRDAQTLGRLARLLDGSPLAIHFAAHSLRLLQPEQLAQKLEKDAWPDSSLHLPGYRYSTLQDVMADTWDQLGPDLQHAWARCALFKGPFALEWAHDCAGAGDRQMTLMVEWSILTSESPGRLVMHAMARQYGLAQLDGMPQRVAYRRAFASAALERLVQQARQLVQEDASPALEALQSETATIAAAFDMMLEWATPEELYPPLAALRRLYQRMGWHRAASRLLDAVMQRHAQAPVEWRIIWHHMAGEVNRDLHGFHFNSEHFSTAASLAGIELPATRPYRGWLRGFRFLVHGALARPAATDVARQAQKALTHALLRLAEYRYVNGAAPSELFVALCAGWLTARRADAPESRILLLGKAVAFEWCRRHPRVSAALLRRIQNNLKYVDPVYEAYAVKSIAQTLLARGDWDDAAAYLRRSSASLGALGYGYDMQESLAQVNMMMMHRGDFRALTDSLWEAENEARRIEQPIILRWTLIFKLQLLLRTGRGMPGEGLDCMRAVHEIPSWRTRMEEIRLCANEALLMASQGDAAAVLERGQFILEQSMSISGARFYTMAPLAVMIDAALHVAADPVLTSDQARGMATALVARYVRLTEGIGIFTPRNRLYKGMVLAMSGQTEQAVQQWQQGLASWPEDDLRYDRARLHWMLHLHTPGAEAAAHASQAERHFIYCGVAGPPYPLVPARRIATDSAEAE